ncbi:MAG: hypothetical protein O9284_11120 [Steroidobacteraceae bacterium]|nr:hypothetical protein [Steroidobacteraceae bacterium]
MAGAAPGPAPKAIARKRCFVSLLARPTRDDCTRIDAVGGHQPQPRHPAGSWPLAAGSWQLAATGCQPLDRAVHLFERLAQKRARASIHAWHSILCGRFEHRWTGSCALYEWLGTSRATELAFSEILHGWRETLRGLEATFSTVDVYSIQTDLGSAGDGALSASARAIPTALRIDERQRSTLRRVARAALARLHRAEYTGAPRVYANSAEAVAADDQPVEPLTIRTPVRS